MQLQEIHIKENYIEKFLPAVSSTEMELHHGLATMVMTCLVNGNYRAVFSRDGISVFLNVKVSTFF